MPSARPTIFITSPLEQGYVDQIRTAANGRADILHDPDLLPPTRYQADHKGIDGFALNIEQQARWRSHLASANILWDFPSGPVEKGGGLALAPNVKWVQTTSSGVGTLVHSLGLADSELIVTTARGVHAVPLAEFVMLCVLAYAKDLLRIQSDQRAHRWERYCCRDVPGGTLLVVGAGQVGAQVGKLARAFGLNVHAVVNRKDPKRAAELNADVIYGPDELHAALAQADYVVLSTPHTPQTDKMIDARAFAAMKRGVVLVNIARGQVVDEAAMIDNLKSGHIGFAGLDVALVEPLPSTSPLWDMPNVLISPHSASTAPIENQKITDIFCHNLRAYLDGRPGDMKNVLDKQRRY